MPQASFVHPPRIAAWLVDLFAPEKQAESIRGDLLEEFSDLTSKSGGAFARRWYWRQSVKTIAYLIGSGFRFAPWRIAGAVLIGRLLVRYGLMLSEAGVVAVTRIYPVTPNYDHTNVIALWTFWVPLAVQIGWVVEAVFIGCVVAMAAKGREMVAVLALVLTFSAQRLSRVLRFRFAQPGIFVAVMVAFVIGGVIVQKNRSAAVRRSSVSRC